MNNQPLDIKHFVRVLSMTVTGGLRENVKNTKFGSKVQSIREKEILEIFPKVGHSEPVIRIDVLYSDVLSEITMVTIKKCDVIDLDIDYSYNSEDPMNKELDQIIIDNNWQKIEGNFGFLSYIINTLRELDVPYQRISLDSEPAQLVEYYHYGKQYVKIADKYDINSSKSAKDAWNYILNTFKFQVNKNYGGNL